MEDTVDRLPPLPEYLRREQSRDYAQKYQEEFLKDMEVNQQVWKDKS